MAVSGERITVSTTPAALNTDADAVAGTHVTVRNNDATNGADLGGPTVAAGAGFLLTAGATQRFELAPGEVLYAIRTGAADVVLSVLRTGA